MADTAVATKADLGPPPSVDVQDPLPEASWFWRRTVTLICIVPFVFVNAATCLFLYWLKDSQALISFAHWNIGFATFAIVIYLAGANAAEIVKLVQSASLLKSGVVTRHKAVAENDQGRVEAETVAGLADSGALGLAGDDSETSPAPDSQISGSSSDGAPSGPSVDLPGYAR